MNWASSRNIMYGFIFLVILIALGVFGFRTILFPTPSCTDSKQNGYEEGVDCGGLCARKCIDQILPVSVLWSRVLPVSDGVYDLVGLISNRNVDASPFTMNATFTVFNKKADVIFSKKVNITPPTAGEAPILIQNVFLKEEPKNVVITLEEGTSYKTPKAFQSVQISVVSTSFENGEIPRAYAMIRNLTRERFTNFPVKILLYDGDQNVIGTGETFVESLDKEADKKVVFTWKDTFTKIPIVIKAYPILSPF